MTLARKRNRRRRPATKAAAVTAGAFTAVYFLLPLEAPLSIPDKSILRSQEKPLPKRDFESDYISIEWDDEEGLVGCRISCCFHQINTPEVDPTHFAAFEAARIAFPHLQFGDAPSKPEPLLAAVTVAEVAVHLAERSDDAVSEALDEAVEFVADVQRVHCALAQEPVPILTRARLPLLVPYVVRDGIPNVLPADWPDEPELKFVMPRAPKRQEYMTTPSEESPARWTLKQLSDVMMPVLQGPFRHVHESWRNASVALRQGDYTVAAILTGVACEQTIRALLLCLLWEEEAEPAAAAALLYEHNGNTRNARALLAKILERLAVSTEQDEAARVAAASVLDLRNGVLHRAHQPTEDEAREAVDRWARFAEWTRLAVLDRLDRYAVTAAMTVSKSVLDDDTAARLDEALTSNLWPTRPNDNVRHYQIEIDRHLPGNEAKRLRKAAQLPRGAWAMMSLAYPNGEVRWVGVDEQNWLAFLARPPRDLPARARQHLQQSIEHAQTESPMHGDKTIIVTRWNDFKPEPQAAEPHLYSWFDLGPVLRSERYARSPTPWIPAG